MNEHTKQNSFRIPGIFMLLLGVVCLGIGAFLFSRPPEFLATTRIGLLHQEPAGANKSATPFPNAADVNQTDVELLQSEIVLGPVIEKLDLATKWGAGQKLVLADVLRLLKQRVKVQSSPGTAFINVAMLDRDREEAAQIANAIAEGYIAHRHEAALDLAQSSVRSFTELRDELRQKIEGAEQEANTMKTNLHITLLSPEAQMNVPIYRTMREQMVELTNALEKVEKKLEMAQNVQDHPPAGAEIVDRADVPWRPIERNPIFPGTFLGGGLLLLLSGFLLGKRQR